MNRHFLKFTATLLLVASCGIPPDSDPQAIAGDVPDALRPIAEQTTTTLGVPELDAREAKIYLLFTNEEDRSLEAVDRTLTGGLSFQTLIQAVVDGPTVEEQENGLSSPIQPADELIIDVVLTDNLLTIDLGDGFWDLVETDRRIAAAQMVFTATAATDVGEVEFLRNGAPRAIPEANGSIEDPRPLTIADFDELNPNIKLDPDTQA